MSSFNEHNILPSNYVFIVQARGIHNQEGKLGRCWIRKGVIGSPTFAAELASNGFTAALANNCADASDYGGDTKCTGVLWNCSI